MPKAGYLVVICGYEGYEDIFGVFTKAQALALALKLKREAPGVDTSDKARHGQTWAKADELGASLPFEAEAVRIMRPGEKGRMEFACEEFPELSTKEEP